MYLLYIIDLAKACDLAKNTFSYIKPPLAASASQKPIKLQLYYIIRKEVSAPPF